MSAETQTNQNDISRAGSLARGADEAFKRLVFLSPLALIALFLFEEVRQYSIGIILAGVLLAVVWAAAE